MEQIYIWICLLYSTKGTMLIQNIKEINKSLMSRWLHYRTELLYVQIESIGLIGQVTLFLICILLVQESL